MCTFRRVGSLKRNRKRMFKRRLCSFPHLTPNFSPLISGVKFVKVLVTGKKISDCVVPLHCVGCRSSCLRSRVLRDSTFRVGRAEVIGSLHGIGISMGPGFQFHEETIALQPQIQPGNPELDIFCSGFAAAVDK